MTAAGPFQAGIQQGKHKKRKSAEIVITSVSSMPGTSDLQLKKLLRTGLVLAAAGFTVGGKPGRDEIALLVDRYHSYLLALLRFKTGDEETAKELLQETYLSFLSALSKKGSKLNFDNDTGIKNYLITIALNKLRNHYRKSGVEKARRRVFSSSDEMDQYFENISSDEKDASDRLADEEKELQLKAATALAMERLPERYRRVLEYKFTKGYDNSRTAELMGLGIKAAESVLFRARAAFKKEFRKIVLKENGFMDRDLYL